MAIVMLPIGVLSAFLCIHVPVFLWGGTGRVESLLLAADISLMVMLAEAAAWWGLDNLLIPILSYMALKSMLAMGEYKTLGKLDPYAAAKVIGQMADELKYITNERPCMVVKFNDLDDEQVIRLAWEWLVGDVEPWCDWHWRELRLMRVVVRPETYTEI